MENNTTHFQSIMNYNFPKNESLARRAFILFDTLEEYKGSLPSFYLTRRNLAKICLQIVQDESDGNDQALTTDNINEIKLYKTWMEVTELNFE